MSLPRFPGGRRGPLYAWEWPAPTVAGVDYTGTIVATVTVTRADGSQVTWSTGGGSLTTTGVTATTLTLRHVLATDGSDLPFQQIGLNDVDCHYTFDTELFVDGVWVGEFRQCAICENTKNC